MNDKGNFEMVGLLIMTFITIIVGLALFNGGITENVASTTTTQGVVNQSVTAAAVNATVNLNGKAIVGTPVVTNATNGTDITSFFTFQSNVLDASTGELTAQMTTLDTGSTFAGLVLGVTYTNQPVGFITSSGGRSLANLIIIFTALAIGVVALVPTLRGKVLELAGI